MLTTAQPSKRSFVPAFFKDKISGGAVHFLILFAAFLHALIIDPYIIDDAFISFRYAANFSDGLGLVFNQGEKVEGYSNLLWTLMLAVAYKLNLNLLYTSWWLGVIFMLIAISATIKLGELLTQSKAVGYLCGLGLAFSFHFVASSMRGLETSLFAALIALSFLWLFSPHKLAKWFLPLSLMALSITRPEGMFLSLLVLGFFLFKSRLELIRNKRPLSALLSALAVIGFVIVMEVDRILYYHELLPMSVIAKRDGISLPLETTLRNIRAGLEYCVNSLGWQAIFLLAFTTIAVVAAFKTTWKERGFYYLTSGAVIGFGVAVIVSNKGDWMTHARLLTPYYPVLMALFVVGVYDLTVSVFRGGDKRLIYVPLVWLTIYTLLQPASQATFLNKNILAKDVLVGGNDGVGPAFVKGYQPGDLFMSGVIGKVGYYGRPVKLFDMLGLTEPSVAKLPIESIVFGKQDSTYLASLHPAMIHHNYWPIMQEIITKTKDEYVGVINPTFLDRRVFIFIRKDVADRIGAPFLATYGGELLDFQTALAKIRERFPNGQ